MRSIRCRRCKQKFEYEGMVPQYCPACTGEKEATFQMVRDLVSAVPGITALEVHEITDVPISLIMQYVEEGHLQIRPDGSEMTEEQRRKLIGQVSSKIKAAKARKEAIQVPNPVEQQAPTGQPLINWH